MDDLDYPPGKGGWFSRGLTVKARQEKGIHDE
jgi:hypothetical protein